MTSESEPPAPRDGAPSPAGSAPDDPSAGPAAASRAASAPDDPSAGPAAGSPVDLAPDAPWRTAAEEPRRLHPAAIVAEALGAALQLVVGLILVAVVRGSAPSTAALYAVAGIGGSVVLGWARWRSATYWLDDVALHYRSGVFTPDERVVPRTRVQAVDTTTGPVQRLFGVLELRVQVPGAADEDEVVLSAVTPGEVARLRAALGQPEPAEPDARVELGLRDLLLAALTGPQISAAVSAVVGVFALLDNVVDPGDGEGLVSQLDSPGRIALVAAIVLAAGYVLSFGAAIFAFAGFSVERDAQVLRIRRGLLARRALSIPLTRVDGVVVVEGLLRSPLGLATLRLETVAQGPEPAAGRTLLPLVRLRDAEAVVACLVPSLAVAPGALERPPPRALRRFVLAPAATATAVGVVGASLVPAAWPAAIVLAVLGAAAGLRAFRAAGIRLSGDVVVVREARLARRTLLARRHRLQEHALARTPLQRRAALADLAVTVGSGGGGRARHLEIATAESAFAALRR